MRHHRSPVCTTALPPGLYCRTSKDPAAAKQSLEVGMIKLMSAVHQSATGLAGGGAGKGQEQGAKAGPDQVLPASQHFTHTRWALDGYMMSTFQL